MPSKDPKMVCSEMLFSYVNLNTALSPYKSVGISLAGLDIGTVSYGCLCYCPTQKHQIVISILCA